MDVPQNHKRAVCDLTVADRLALYDHVVGVLSRQKEAASSSDDLYLDLVSKLQKGESPASEGDLLSVPLFSRAGSAHRARWGPPFISWVCFRVDEEQNEPKSHLELIAEMRDYKRRRQSYRAKNVHITKKSYTEVGGVA